MRIAGNTIRRNYLSRYEQNYSTKYDSEKKIYSGRQFDRASENPINAARALRIRKSIAECETHQANLQTADSIYTNAESSMIRVSSILQSVYEKLVEGAHGTRNPDDLEILAMEVENYAEEMVQSFNVDIADRKIFGGMNNTTNAFKIEQSSLGGDKYVTYNGVAVNSSNDPQSFPYGGVSYVDIGIGMTDDDLTGRIDDQSALPVTFNGAECTGCGMTRKTASIDLNSLHAGKSYSMDIYAGGKSRTIDFTIDDADDPQNQKKLELINEKLKEAFRSAPEVQDDGSFEYIEEPQLMTYGTVSVKDNRVNLNSILNDNDSANKFYSMSVKINGKTRIIDFQGSTDGNTLNENINKVLREKFQATDAYIDGYGQVHLGNRYDGLIESRLEDISECPITDGKIDFGSLADGTTYAVHLSTPVLGTDGKPKQLTDENGDPVTDENGDPVYDYGTNGEMIYFTSSGDPEADKKAINDYIVNNALFGESVFPAVNETGTIEYDVDGANVIINNNPKAQDQFEYTEINGYPKNIIQLVLDSAGLLRKCDQQMVARYADLLFEAQGNLSIAIADLGTHSKFIEFNKERLDDVLINLNSKQNDIESTDLPSEITNWKVLESIYNASLQMGAQVLSQTIFNYIS